MSGDPIEPTAAIDGEDADDTIVVSEVNDDTVVVGEDADDTIVVGEDDDTVVVGRAEGQAEPGGEDHDETILVAGDDSAGGGGGVGVGAGPDVEVTAAPATTDRLAGVSNDRIVAPRRGSRRRGELRPAPVPTGFARAAVAGVGAGTVMSYPVTSGLGQRTAPMVSAAGDQPTRTLVPSMPSVLTRAAMGARITIAAFAASFVVSAGGIAILLLTLLR